jgi:hypothetical protein
MVGIITSSEKSTNVSQAPKYTTTGEHVDLEMQEFERPVIVRGNDLPAGNRGREREREIAYKHY